MSGHFVKCHVCIEASEGGGRAYRPHAKTLKNNREGSGQESDRRQ